MVSRNVRNFGKIRDAVEVPDLVAIQRKGFEDFLQKDVAPTRRKCVGLEALFQEIFPIESYDKSMKLEYLCYELESPHYTPVQCRQLRLTYGYPLKIHCRLTTKNSADSTEQAIYLGEMPIMIGGGEFIINGAVRVIVNQLHRSPGVDFLIESKEGDRVLHGGRIIPERGSWIEIGVTHKDVLAVKIDQSSKIPATVFLRAIDPNCATTGAILRLFYKTKNVPLDKLSPTMWAVEPIVDGETGEIIVKAGTQLSDKVSIVQQALGEKGTTIPEIGFLQKLCRCKEDDRSQFLNSDFKKGEPAYEWLRRVYMEISPGLEFTVVRTDEDGAYLEMDELKALEEKLMLKYPEEPQGDVKKPRLNEDKPRPIKELDQIFKGNPKLDRLFKKCKEQVGNEESWYSVYEKGVAESSAYVKKQYSDEHQGVYFFRPRGGRVNEGYIGLAGKGKEEGQKQGLRTRLGNHFTGNFQTKSGALGTDTSFLKRMMDDCLKRAPTIEKEVRRCLQKGKKARRAKQIEEIEVIESPRDTMILTTLKEDDCQSHEQALLKFYMRLRPGNPPNEEKARAFFAEKFFDRNRYRLGRVGRFRLNRKFNQSVPEDEMTLRPEDFFNTMKYIAGLRNNEGEVDDIDHLGNRRLRTIDELAADEIRKGLLKLRKTVQERMSMKRDVEEPLRVADLVNSKSVSSSINYFFGRGELSQVVDQTNALSQLTHERRLSALGPGGLNRRRAGFEVRDVHISHYGRICPIETPEGTNIGLIASLAIFATIDEYGFLLTPYCKVQNGKLTGEVEYLRADDEMKAIFAPPSAVDPQSGKIHKGQVLAREKGELSHVDSGAVNYVDISPKQIVGISAALIPFLEHDDANRALMGSNMQRQAVPLLSAEPPLVGTGMEEVVGNNSSMVIRARNAGQVTQVDATRIVIDQTDEYELEKFVGLNERTCLNQKPIVKLGEKVRKGQVIADGGGTSEGILSLGKNILVGFVSYDGFNFEDAIIVSERLCRDDSFTSIHIDEFTGEVRETRLGKEEFTADIPNVSERALRNLDEYGIVREGTRVCTGDILVGKVVPKSKTELTPEEKLLHAIFGRAGEDVKNDSLELPSGYEGVVIKTERFMRRGAGSDEEKKVLAAQIKDYEKQMRAKECVLFRQLIEAILKKLEVNIIDPSTRQKVGASDDDEVIYEQIENFSIKWVRPAASRDDAQKIVDRFWVKIREVQEEKTRRIETLKHGDELPSGVLQMAKVYVAIKRSLSIGDKVAGRHGNKGVIAKIMPEEDMPFLEDGTPLDILLNPLGVPSRMNVGQILETHLGWVAKVLGFIAVTPVFDGATEAKIQELMAEANELVNRRKAELDGKKVISKKVTSIQDAKEFLRETLEFQYVTVSADKISRKELERIEERLMLEFPCSGKVHVPEFNKKGVKIEDVEAFKETFEKETSNYEKEIFTKSLKYIRDKKEWFRDPKDAPKEQSGVYFFRDVKTKSVGLGYVGIAYDRKDGINGRMVSHYNQNDDSLLISISEKHPEFEKLVSQFEKQAPPVDEFFVTVPKTLKTQLYDGRTGEPFDQQATIGYIYMMKLHHLVDDKIHARATGPYSLITQQPLGGKARTGGQRFGEMEVWALEGYGAAYTLQEMLTVKSDDVEGRTKIYESMVKGQNTLEAGTPLSFDVLCNEIRGLGLNIQLDKKRLGSDTL